MSQASSQVDRELCLDFTGTLDWRTSASPKEYLLSFEDLIKWSLKKKIIGKSEADDLRAAASDDQAYLDHNLEEALQLRESIFRIFMAEIHHGKADPKDLGVLKSHLEKGYSNRMLVRGLTGYNWAWHSNETLGRILFPIAQSAADLLTSEDVARVKECANKGDGCAALFLDGSKTHTRRWCSMDSCGNRVKFRTYYARHNRPIKAV